MKRSDLIAVLIFLAIIAAFAFCAPLLEGYTQFNAQHGYITAFLKFALLATFGEMLAARIRCGQYLPAGFGLVPRAVVWGLLGITIQFAFKVFAGGVPPTLEDLGLTHAATALQGELGLTRILTDLHIQEYQGSMQALVHPIKVRAIMSERIDWKQMWSFVYKKTIPFFWIPAHTISFLLPAAYRTLFAALLGVALGLILTIAVKKR